jgi:hypothetical protein
MLSSLDKRWGFTTEQVIECNRIIKDVGGSVTWDLPVKLNGEIEQSSPIQLAALGKSFPENS